MQITFLSKTQAQEYFTQPDDYARNLPKSNLQMICPANPTVQGYQEIFINSFEDFTPPEMARINQYVRTLSWLNLNVKLAKTSGAHSLDITQTRKDVIVVTRGLIGEATFVHEVYHVLSRRHPEITRAIAPIFGFQNTTPQEITESDFLLNPDALVCDYKIQVELRETKQPIWVTPFVKSGLGTGLKTEEGKYLDGRETNYAELIPNTSYLAHPEEICAEYFSLLHLGICIFYKRPLVSEKIIEYSQKLLSVIPQNRVLSQDLFPNFIETLKNQEKL